MVIHDATLRIKERYYYMVSNSFLDKNSLMMYETTMLMLPMVRLMHFHSNAFWGGLNLFD